MSYTHQSREDSSDRVPSIRDIARCAGVSSQTVSRVVNHSPNVSPVTRDKVEKILHDMGYRQNHNARTLRLGQSHTLGLMISYLETSGNAMLLKSITDSAFARGYAVMLLPSVDDVAEELHNRRSFILSQRFDGLIIVSGNAVNPAATKILPNIETVLVGYMQDDPHVWTIIDIDQEMISVLAVEHLLSLGHRTVHHIRGEKPSVAAQLREDGWRSALRAHGRSIPQIEYGDWTADSGYAAGLRLADDNECTAVYAANDTMALGAIQALREHGHRVPEDVSVIGVDDSLEGVIPMNMLTTVRQNPSQIGMRVVDEIITRLSSQVKPKHRSIRLQPELIIRKSTARPDLRTNPSPKAAI